MGESQPHERREIVFRGRVQGVGFRFTAQRLAAQSLLTGFVENLPDGGVRFVAEGATAQIERCLEAVREVFGLYIAGTEQSVGPATGAFDRFSIRH